MAADMHIRLVSLDTSICIIRTGLRRCAALNQSYDCLHQGSIGVLCRHGAGIQFVQSIVCQERPGHANAFPGGMHASASIPVHAMCSRFLGNPSSVFKHHAAGEGPCSIPPSCLKFCSRLDGQAAEDRMLSMEVPMSVIRKWQGIC